MKLLLLIVKNVGRNPLRSILTALGTMVLVLVVTLVWSILYFIDRATDEKSKDFKAIVTERWSIPSRLPYSYAASLSEGAARKDHPEDVRPADSMTWQFYGGTLDPKNLSMQTIIFGLACDPEKLLTMMDGLDNLPKAENEQLHGYVESLKAKRYGIIVGQNHLQNLNKLIGNAQDDTLRDPIGRRFNLSGFASFVGLDLEFEIVGVFPPGRYDNFAAFNREYFNSAFDAYKVAHAGHEHPLADRNLSLVWLKVPDKDAYNRVAEQITRSYSNPAVKCETASSGIASFLEGYRTLLWFMRWPLALACFVTLILVIANAISISVRERRPEIAVMKVLGFSPRHVLFLVLGESLLLGLLAGLLSAGLTYVYIDLYLGGLKFPVAFFDRFLVPIEALAWGPGIGVFTAFLGSIVPAWFACRIKPAEVFSKVA